MTIRLALLLLLACGVSTGAAAQAQNFRNDQSRYGRAAVYRYAEEGDVVIRVNVWGAAQNTGIYEVPRGTQLNTLFSAAGGPRIGVRERVDEQTINVKLVRTGESGEPEVIYEQTMEGELLVSQENPRLQDGDVLTITSYVVQGVDWRDVLSIGSSLTTLAITVINFATR